MHRHKDRVRSGERKKEVHPSPGLVHHPAEHLREPVICTSEHAEDRSNTHDQMKVTDHKRCIVQRNIKHRLCQERPAQSSRDEQRNEPNGEQHRGVEAYPSTPDRA